jgi:hypothetical protein
MALHIFIDISYNTEVHQNTYMKEPSHYYLHVFIIVNFD